MRSVPDTVCATVHFLAVVAPAASGVASESARTGPSQAWVLGLGFNPIRLTGRGQTALRGSMEPVDCEAAPPPFEHERDWRLRIEPSALFSMSWFCLIRSSSLSRNDFIDDPDDGALNERNLCHDVGNGCKRGEKQKYDSDSGQAIGAL